MASFRLLHVSDLHVGAKPNVLGGVDVLLHGQHPTGTLSPLSASSWDRNLGDIVNGFAERNHQLQALDAIVVSGDLATTGKKADLVGARDYVIRLFGAINWKTGPANDRTAAIRRIVLFPGNHDRFRRGLFFPGGSRFDSIFGGYWQGPVQTTTLDNTSAGECLSIIQADFSLRKRSHARWASLDYLGQGRVYADVLATLKNATQKAHDAGDAVVWAVHFPPAFAPLADALRLQNQMNLIYAARDLQVPCIFAGHTHVPSRYSVSGVDVLCAGTATQLVAPPAAGFAGNCIHPCTISVRGGTVTNVDWQTWGWQPNRLAFTPNSIPAGNWIP